MFSVGMKKSPRDERDYIYGNIRNPKELPSKFFRTTVPIRNQGQLGSCVGFASTCVKDKQEKINHPGKNYQLSPLFVYAECKKRDGIPNTEGTYPRVAMEVLQKLGTCLESTFKYSDDKIIRPIPKEAYEEAKNFRIKYYAKLNNSVQEVKQAIFQDGPVLGAIFVTDSFMYPENGFINMPQGYWHGGHAITLDGWDDNLEHIYKNGRREKGFLRFVNSWGEEWGDKGYGWLPYSFFDFEVIDLPGMKYFLEAWTLIDEITQVEPVKELILWVDETTAIADGKEIRLDQAPKIDPKSWRTLVPLRQTCELFGEKVQWVPDDARIEIGNRIKLWIDDITAEVDDKKIVIDQPPVVDSITWRTLIPINFVSTVLGYKVQWIASEKKIIIKK